MFVAPRGQARPRRRQRHGEQRGALQVRLVAADAHCAMSATSDGARPCRAGAARLPILPWRRFLRPRKTNYLPRPETGSPQLASCWGACGRPSAAVSQKGLSSRLQSSRSTTRQRRTRSRSAAEYRRSRATALKTRASQKGSSSRLERSSNTTRQRRARSRSAAEYRRSRATALKL